MYNLLNVKSTLNFLLTHTKRESASRTLKRGGGAGRSGAEKRNLIWCCSWEKFLGWHERKFFFKLCPLWSIFQKYFVSCFTAKEKTAANKGRNLVFFCSPAGEQPFSCCSCRVQRPAEESEKLWKFISPILPWCCKRTTRRWRAGRCLFLFLSSCFPGRGSRNTSGLLSPLLWFSFPCPLLSAPPLSLHLPPSPLALPGFCRLIALH